MNNLEVVESFESIENINSISTEEILNSKSVEENFSAGFQIMGFGLLAVFGVLTILYIVIKIMGQFAKKNEN